MWFFKKREAKLKQIGIDLDKRERDLRSAQEAFEQTKSAFEREREEIREGMKKYHQAVKALERRADELKEREEKAAEALSEKTKTLVLLYDVESRQQANEEISRHLAKRSDDIAKDRESIVVDKAKLVKREEAIKVVEQKRDAGFADERAALNVELRDKRAKMESAIADVRERKSSILEDEITKLRTKRLVDITKAEGAERDRIHAEIANERGAWAKQQEDARKRLEVERTELEKQKSAVSALRSELEGRNTELEANERTLERKEQRLEQQWRKRNDELDNRIEERLEEERKSIEAERQSFKDENDRLRQSIRIQTELVGAFDQLKRQLEDKDPAEAIRDLNWKTDELKRLHEKLATCPTEEMREKYQEMDSESQLQKARIEELEKQVNANATAVAKTKDLRRKNSELDAENKSLAHKASIFEGAANEAQAELSRLRAAYERPAEVAAHYNEIEMPHIKAEKAKQPMKPDQDSPIDEITWLTGIGNACNKYGLHFNPRILKAFHTALKTAEWSPITILAGVSGTGKSELPRLYSHFGGLMFEPLSVQPNWDSQESMLGFFNSIDNKFDAQPVLHFLAQSQKKWIDKTNDDEGYPGLQDVVCLVLLDEMNLAHPELYFAEFLSKLELRRGMKGADVPFLPVKIGAGMPPYHLPLGRNILWTGTMNQDETTKSLSDKVLDRSIIIHFPRPTELKRRLKLTPLDEKNRGTLLHKVSWQNWLAQGSSFTDDAVKPYKDFIESMNATLAVVGRAIGHRVWQSIEYYMANYPDVRAAQIETKKEKNTVAGEALDKALHVAFEDQLVQKVMPKLRGIDTRGNGEECLKKILEKINTGIGGNSFNLAEDFNLACELGYGQFIWQSANYIKDEPASGKVDVVTPDEKQTEITQLK
ncbi:MAG: chromosome partitioning protein ParA [Desulfobacteraceae bacterium A6]|nr:MAG: chromosome partitioning protein ParA [Desulfobacteraceae bacterium A6]